jgi:hypothetical protein
MRWKDNTEKRSYYKDLIIAGIIVGNAYEEGYINWNVFQKAIKKMDTNRNTMLNNPGMFVTNIKKENLYKSIEDWE